MVNFNIASPEFQNQHPSLGAHAIICPHFNPSHRPSAFPPTRPLTVAISPSFFAVLNLIPHLLSSALLLIPQILSAHMVNLIHIPSSTLAFSARQRVVAAGNPNRSLFSTVTDGSYRVAMPHTKSKWNEKNYWTINEEKTLPL
jgi:hypothetical protein